VAADAGAAVVGGHSITDPEPKYGMCVIGFVDPRRMTTNAAARPGDSLYLTKPLGLGMISTAIKQGVASEQQIAAAVQTMTGLNAAASAAMLAAGVSAATDVTGFGLLGHLKEMSLASGVEAEIDASGPDLLDGALELASRGVVAGGTRRNLDFVSAVTDFGDLPEPERLLLADAQTSGGLLIATAEPDRLEAEMDSRGVPHTRVGRVVEGTAGNIRVSGRVRAS
jgi:selenide,water dikinase